MNIDKLYRQGDVLIMRVEGKCVPGAEVKRDKGRVVLAYGEVTGHAHAIRSRAATLYELPVDKSIAAADIDGERNAEVRRVMIERIGLERYILESGAKEVARDDVGVLYRKEQVEDEPILTVKVRNNTPEPDGSVKDYFLRVPPTIQTPREGIAWTFTPPAPAGTDDERAWMQKHFGHGGERYQPEMET